LEAIGKYLPCPTVRFFAAVAYRWGRHNNVDKKGKFYKVYYQEEN